MVIGEAEPVIDPLVQTLWDTLSGPRDVMWQALAQIPGIYVPYLRAPPTEAVGAPPTEAVGAPPTEAVGAPPTEAVGALPTNAVGVPPTEAVGALPINAVGVLPTASVGRPPEAAFPPPVQRQWVRDLDAYPTATVVHTPDTEFGGMHLIEIARGCGRGCRFCLAGYLCRPKRERSADAILQEARRGLGWTERIGLVGAAVSDYTQIDELAVRLREMGARLSVSSLRVDPLSEALLGALAESGTQTLTLAPEAGSERLRQIVNKGVTEADLLVAAERATTYHFRQLKLYFMLGLPTEDENDVEAIARLCEAAAARFHGQVTANVTPFVPKAHTPFQWMAMTPSEAIQEQLRKLESRLQRQGIAVKSESPRWSAIQGVLSRGDRRLGKVLASLRGRSLRAWDRAMAEHDIQPTDYLKSRARDARLPWQFIQTGVSTAYLQREWQRAQTASATVPCPPSDCSRCGVCP
jgi:radical SAM superfamily enzyme YgiQ (UPF0313 family)